MLKQLGGGSVFEDALSMYLNLCCIIEEVFLSRPAAFLLLIDFFLYGQRVPFRELTKIDDR